MELVELFSPQIRAAIVNSMSSQLLHHVWFLKECEQGMLIELAVKLRRVVYAHDENVVLGRFYTVTRGIVARAGKVI